MLQNTFYNKYNRTNTVTFVKYVILIWTPHLHKWETIPFGEGQNELYNKNCKFKNCYFTSNRNYFGGSLKEFDAIIFSGIWTNEKWYSKNLPKQRYSHQKYVFISAEPGALHPLCSKTFDYFFNWTYTYKLDSDCVLTYIKLEDKAGKVIYPKKGMQWVKNSKEVSKSFKEKLRSKRKAAAWFVSHCNAISKRDMIYSLLNNELHEYNLEIDVYGGCGKLKCSKSNKYRNCYTMLERDYYFYLAFENSLCDDYVSEKVLHALLNRVVPIVYGGANYSWFLPPGSYLDARAKPVAQIALEMRNSIRDPERYAAFFKWTNDYRYLNNGSGVPYSDVDINICNFCKLFNDKKKFEKHSIYKDMRSWWFPGYKQQCKS